MSGTTEAITTTYADILYSEPLTTEIYGDDDETTSNAVSLTTFDVGISVFSTPASPITLLPPPIFVPTTSNSILATLFPLDYTGDKRNARAQARFYLSFDDVTYWLVPGLALLIMIISTAVLSVIVCRRRNNHTGYRSMASDWENLSNNIKPAGAQKRTTPFQHNNTRNTELTKTTYDSTNLPANRQIDHRSFKPMRHDNKLSKTPTEKENDNHSIEDQNRNEKTTIRSLPMPSINNQNPDPSRSIIGLYDYPEMKAFERNVRNTPRVMSSSQWKPGTFDSQKTELKLNIDNAGHITSLVLNARPDTPTNHTSPPPKQSEHQHTAPHIRQRFKASSSKFSPKSSARWRSSNSRQLDPKKSKKLPVQRRWRFKPEIEQHHVQRPSRWSIQQNANHLGQRSNQSSWKLGGTRREDGSSFTNTVLRPSLQRVSRPVVRL